MNTVHVSDGTIYAGTAMTGNPLTGGGLSISTDGGTTFAKYTIENGLADNDVQGIALSGSTIYLAT